ncbi:MAG: T9SS type A sorting domain-containing protein, partial [Salinivenus sp.]
VRFAVQEPSETEVAVYNVLGQRVKTLYNDTPQAEQTTEVTFDASELPSGMYFVRMQADGQAQSERLTVVR